MKYVIRSQSIYVVSFLLFAVATSTSTMTSPIHWNNHHHTKNNHQYPNDNQQNHHDSCEPQKFSETRQDDLTTSTNMNINTILNDLQTKYQHQPLFLQAIQEMVLSIRDLLDQNPMYRQAFAVMTEPERTISFRVTWMDDHGQLQINRGWRIEFNR